MMTIRRCKALLVAGIAFFFTLVAFGNVTDYGSNFAFVQHVLSMDTIFPDSTLRWRALPQPAVHHAAYALIIAWQIATALLCWLGAARLWAASDDRVAFAQARPMAVAGLTAAWLLYAAGFMTVGGEWFAMWQSATWNGQAKAAQFLVMIGIVLLAVLSHEEA